MALLDVFTQLTTKLTSLKSNRVVSFAYTQDAYVTDVVAANENKGNSIPEATEEATATNTRVLTKGERSQSASLARNLINHFFGRSSFSLNKVIDTVQVLAALIQDSLQNGTGIASLGSNGRVPESQIPEDIINYRGAWNASTNTPDLSTVTKEKGDMYLVSVAGTQGGVKYFAGDQVIYNGSVWEKIASGNVDTVNHKTPEADRNVVLYGDDVEADLPYPLTMNFEQGTYDKLFNILTGTYVNGMYFISVGTRSLWWSEDGVTWTRCAGITDNTANEVIYYNGLYVTGSTNGRGLWWSEDGKSWTVSNIAAYSFFVRHGGNKWIAFSTNTNGIYYSSDGKSWTKVTGATTNISFNFALYTEGLWTASCYTANGLWWSEDGVTWTQGTGGETLRFRDICYGNGVWVTGGQETRQDVWWSADGKSWTQGTLNGVTFHTPFYHIIYDNGLFIAGSRGRGLWWSTDGKVWTQGTGGTNANINALAKGSNGKYIAGMQDWGIWYSSDGKSWTQVQGETNQLTANTVFTDGVKDFVGFLWYGLWVSSDSVLWEKGQLPFNCVVRKFTRAFGKLIALSPTNALYSEDGITWDAGKNNLTGCVDFARYGNIMLAANWSSLPYWTEDGINWTRVTADFATVPCHGICFGNGLFVVGSEGRGLSWSSDGKNFTQVTGVTSTYTFRSIYYADGLWVAGSQSHGLWWSTDGKAWTQGTGAMSTYTFQIYSVAKLNGLWIACSQAHGMWWSADGKAWTQGTGGTTYSFYLARYSVYYEKWYAGSDNSHGLWESSDGKNWTQIQFRTNSSFRDILPDGKEIIAASQAGIHRTKNGTTWEDVDTSNAFYTVYRDNVTEKIYAGCYDTTPNGIWSTEAKTKASISYIISYLKEKFGYTTT